MQSLGTPLVDSRSLVRLFAHEATRVFADRLVDDADRGWFCGLLAELVPKHTAVSFAEAFPVSPAEEAEALAGVAPAAHHHHQAAALSGPAQPLAAAADPDSGRRALAAAALRNVLFADFVQPGSSPSGAETSRYQEATDAARLLKHVEDALADYNEQVSECGAVVRCWLCSQLPVMLVQCLKTRCVAALLCGVRSRAASTWSCSDMLQSTWRASAASSGSPTAMPCS
jgi:dynein heavy chain